MASYTIEDIELIRRKSGISYQEAVALLDYHNGNVARALVDLERNGRIKSDREQKSAQHASKHSDSKKGFVNLMSKLYRARLKVKKDNIVILNLSLLFSILALLISPHLVIVGAIVMLILGYKLSFVKRDPDFASANLEKMVRNAAQNAKESVSSMVQEFTGDDEEEAPKAEPVNAAEEKRSYYQSNPAATTYHHAASPERDVPTLQVPVQVESQDGSVTVESDRDGFTNATIE